MDFKDAYNELKHLNESNDFYLFKMQEFLDDISKYKYTEDSIDIATQLDRRDKDQFIKAIKDALAKEFPGREAKVNVKSSSRLGRSRLGQVGDTRFYSNVFSYKVI